MRSGKQLLRDLLREIFISHLNSCFNYSTKQDLIRPQPATIAFSTQNHIASPNTAIAFFGQLECLEEKVALPSTVETPVQEG